MTVQSQQRVQTWGNSKPVAFTVSGTSVTLSPTSTGQLVMAEADEPIVWLVQMVINVDGFEGEVNPVTVELVTNVGVGQAMQVIRGTPYTYTFASPNYASVSDQGFIPAQALNIEARVSGGPFTVAGQHAVTVGVFVAPWNNALVEHERRTERALVSALMGHEQRMHEMFRRLLGRP